MTGIKTPATSGGFRRALAGFILLAVLVILGWRLLTPRDQAVAEWQMAEDQLKVQVLARKAVFGSARLFLVVEEARLGESQRIYLRTWEGRLADLGKPQVERLGRNRIRVRWPMGLSDDTTVALRVLQPEPPK